MGALAPPEYQQAQLVAALLLLEMRELAAHRVSRDRAPSSEIPERFFKRHTGRIHKTRKNSIRKPGHSVWLNHHCGYAFQRRRQQSRPRRITANPYDQVRSKAPDHRPGACEAGRKSGQRPGPFRDRYALERPHSNELQAEALAGDDPRFQPASSSDEADFNFRVPPLEFTRDRQAGENMAPGPARRNQDLQRQLSPPYCAMTVGASLRVAPHSPFQTAFETMKT